MQKEGKKKKLSLFLQTAPRIEFPDQSHLNQCSQRERFAFERIAVFANILVIIVKYYLKGLKKGSLVETAFCMVHFGPLNDYNFFGIFLQYL